MKTIINWVKQSRKHVLITAVLLLLLLDAGRSIYARVAYAEPAEAWQEVPYEALPWPPGDGESAAAVGDQIYVEKCAVCHGTTGEGNGAGAISMIPRPRDFTLGDYKYKSTPAGQPPTDEDLFNVIADGLPASGMPYWSDILSDEEITAVIATLKTFSPIFDGSTPQPIAIPERVSPDEASIARGETFFMEKGCAGCHGADLRGDNKLQDSKGNPVHSRDLTAPWTFRGGSQPEQIWLRLTTGLAPSPMPSHAETMSDDERWDTVNYLLSQSRIAPWDAGGVLDGPGHDENLVKRGEYLIHMEMCGLCHTQVSSDLRYSGEEYYLAGGMGIPIYPQGVFVSRNLTSDPETGLGNWTAEEVADAIRNGRSPDRNLNLWGMPWFVLHSASEEDALAMGNYLKTLPPTYNKIPPPLTYGVAESLIMKTASTTGIPPMGNPKSLVYRDGNFGQTEPGFLSRGWLQSVLVSLQWFVFGAGLIAFVWVAPSEKRWPHGVKGWAKSAAKIMGLLLLWGIGWLLVNTPVLPFVPPEQINMAVTSTIHTPDPASFSTPEEAALAERGQYLFTITSCAYCHGNDGSGGNKLSSRDSFGRIWSRNISSDPETGIGDWSEAEIARAIRSGVSNDGSPLHWQGMIWDHFSNLDEEDVQALVIYLQAMPPVVKEIPAPQPPSADDCAEYTFYISDTDEAGCE